MKSTLVMTTYQVMHYPELIKGFAIWPCFCGFYICVIHDLRESPRYNNALITEKEILKRFSE